jgi:hypothetical protein
LIQKSCVPVGFLKPERFDGMVPLVKAQNLAVVATPVDFDVQNLNDE